MGVAIGVQRAAENYCPEVRRRGEGAEREEGGGGDEPGRRGGGREEREDERAAQVRRGL